jgi:putative DNA primase/helicase
MTGAAEIEAQFRDAAAERNLEIKTLKSDGEYHRCNIKGDKSGKGDGTYKLCHGLNGSWGGFQNWKDDRGWQNWTSSFYRVLSPEQRQKYREERERERQREIAAEKAAQASARASARDILSGIEPAEPATLSHAYIDRKCLQRVHSTFVAVRTDLRLKMRKGDLIVPMRDIEGTLHSLQFIPQAEGKLKLFMKGGRAKGCFFGIGRPEASDTVAIGTGFATSATVYESTAIPIAAALSDINLLPVALAIRTKYPQKRLLLVSVDDWLKPGNPGLTKARAAAEAVQGILAVPDFGNPRERRPKHTDFNDLQTGGYGGRAEVHRQIMVVLDA